MSHKKMTLSKFLIEEQRRPDAASGALAALLNDVQTACKFIDVAVGRGALDQSGAAEPNGSRNVHGEDQKPLDLAANEIMLETCEWGGQLCGMVSEELDQPYLVPAARCFGRYLLVFDPLDGSSNLDINMTVGTIFSVLRMKEERHGPSEEDFLQPGTEQVAAGYALYGPVSMLVITLGRGVHGFTLDRTIGAYMLTHPDMRVPEHTQEFAINASNMRFWEPPIRRYVDECLDGKTGPREKDFNMRWIASMVAEVHRILIRGGLFMYPRDTKDTSKPGRLRLMYEANPMAMLMEQAGGGASTGRERLLDIRPSGIHQRVPVILGSRAEVDRIASYHASYDRGDAERFDAPLFKNRSLFRTV